MNDKIKMMTFGELRVELSKSMDNPVKEMVIRELMLMRYNQHIQKKIVMEQRQQAIKQKQLAKQNKRVEEEEIIEFTKNDFEIKPKLNSLNELDDFDKDDLYDDRDITEYERDKFNNNLMDRMNGDIDIRTNKKKQISMDFPPPYSNNSGDNYAPFHSKQKPKNDFSNIKINKNNIH